MESLHCLATEVEIIETWSKHLTDIQPRARSVSFGLTDTGDAETGYAKADDGRRNHPRAAWIYQSLTSGSSCQQYTIQLSCDDTKAKE